jgi:hypothetical protein
MLETLALPSAAAVLVPARTTRGAGAAATGAGAAEYT